MEIIELVPGAHFPGAVELPNKNVRWVNGTNKSSPGGNSVPKRKGRMVIPGKMHADILKQSQEQTRRHAKILVISGGKRRWVLASEWKD